MSLLDEATKLQSVPGVPCAVDNLKKSDLALHDELMTALAAPVQVAAISRALKAEHQILMAPDVLSRHRRGDCVKCRS